jgi:hypothetical protein
MKIIMIVKILNNWVVFIYKNIELLIIYYCLNIGEKNEK